MILHIIVSEVEQRTKYYLFTYIFLDLINAWKMEHVKILK